MAYRLIGRRKRSVGPSACPFNFQVTRYVPGPRAGYWRAWRTVEPQVAPLCRKTGKEPQRTYPAAPLPGPLTQSVYREK